MTAREHKYPLSEYSSPYAPAIQSIRKENGSWKRKKDTFTYTYSAKQQEEIRNIRKKYLPREEDKMEQLRRLDRGHHKKRGRLFPSL